MSDTDTQQDEGGIAGLREAARRGQAATEENAELRRQLIFARAGIDTETELGGMLYRTWDGGDDITALKEKALRIGALAVPAAPAQPQPTAEELQRQQEDADRQAAYLSTGNGQAAPPPQFSGDHPRDSALVAYQRAVQEGTPEEDARVDALAKVIGAGLTGDKRVFFDEDAHRARAIEADRNARTQ